MDPPAIAALKVTDWVRAKRKLNKCINSFIAQWFPKGVDTKGNDLDFLASSFTGSAYVLSTSKSG